MSENMGAGMGGAFGSPSVAQPDGKVSSHTGVGAAGSSQSMRIGNKINKEKESFLPRVDSKQKMWFIYKWQLILISIHLMIYILNT